MIFGLEALDFILLVVISLAICVIVCSMAMEAAVLFTPAFLFLFPVIMTDFPTVTPNGAIGLAITIEFFGYTSSVLGYYFRRQIDLRLGFRILAYTVPLAVIGRLVAFVLPGQVLLFAFVLILLILAVIIFRAYQGEIRHTCLLCGDSLTAMKFESASAHGQPKDLSAAASPVQKKPYPRISENVILNFADRLILGTAGAFAGIVGVAIGEISNTFLTVRKQISVKLATGTSALVLHLTILSALVTNLVVLFGNVPFLHAEEIVIPWRIAFIVAPVVIVGGQIGSYLNSKLGDRTLIRMLMTAYVLVGLFVLVQITFG